MSLSALDTVALIKETIKGELRVVSEVKTAVEQVKQRIESVELEVTKQVGGTMQLLTQLHDKQDVQSGHIAGLREDHENLVMRMELLEGKMATFSPAGSTASTEQDKKPAIILGGWAEDQQAGETLDKAKDMVRQLRLNLDMDEAFVPGVRRGYVIIPYGPRGGETPEQLRGRIRDSILKVKDATVKLGTRDNGDPQYLWLSISQTPERRRRVAFAGKVKRLILEKGGHKKDLEVEWQSGTVWYSDKRVASAMSLKPTGADEHKSGWVMLRTLCHQLAIPENNMRERWEELSATLR